MYANFPTPLDHGAVRLAVLQPPAVIRAAAHEAADAVARALPAGMRLIVAAQFAHFLGTESLADANVSACKCENGAHCKEEAPAHAGIPHHMYCLLNQVRLPARKDDIRAEMLESMRLFQHGMLQCRQHMTTGRLGVRRHQGAPDWHQQPSHHAFHDLSGTCAALCCMLFASRHSATRLRHTLLCRPAVLADSVSRVQAGGSSFAITLRHTLGPVGGAGDICSRATSHPDALTWQAAAYTCLKAAWFTLYEQ